MPRAIWSGSISFGLVNIPVRLMAATVDKDIHFHQVDAKSGDRIRQKRVSERTGREVDSERVANGFELDSGKWVILEDEELKAADPARTHTIEIDAFVALAEIDPLQFERGYWVVPDDQEGAKRAYNLLRIAMEDQDRVAIGRYVMRTKEHLVALRPLQNVLSLHTMRFADELVKASSVAGLPVRTKPSPAEKKSAAQLIEALAADWDPTSYRDRHRAKLKKIIDRKAKGEAIEVTEPEELAPVTDLMAALEESVAAAKKARTKRRRKSA